MTATAYGMTEDLKTVEYGRVTLAEALASLDKRLRGLRSFYESGEKALSETMFGFSRGDNEFVELCVHAPNHISCTIELPSLVPDWKGRLFGKTGRVEFDLDSREKVAEIVTDFFNLSEADFGNRVGKRAQ